MGKLIDLYIVPGRDASYFPHYHIFGRTRRGYEWICKHLDIPVPDRMYATTSQEGRDEIVPLARADGLTIEEP